MADASRKWEGSLAFRDGLSRAMLFVHRDDVDARSGRSCGLSPLRAGSSRGEWFSAGARASRDEKKFIYLISINARLDKGGILQM
jgi:hypothetical protein